MRHLGGLDSYLLSFTGHRTRTASTREAAELHADPTRGEFLDLLSACIKLAWAAGRREFLLISSCQVIAASIVFLQLLVARAVFYRTFDEQAANALTSVALALGLFLSLGALGDLAQTVAAEQSRVLAELVGQKTLDGVIETTGSVDLVAYESADFHDRLQRARTQGAFRTMSMVNGLFGVFGSGIAALGILLALVHLQPFLLPLAGISAIALTVATSRNSRDAYQSATELVETDRKRTYLERLLLERGPAKEVRTFQLADYLRNRRNALCDLRVIELRRLARRRILRSSVSILAGAAASIAAFLLLIWFHVSGSLTLAAAATAVVGLSMLIGRIRGVHTGASSLHESVLFLKDLSSFLDRHISVEDRNPAHKLPSVRSLELLNVDEVSFCYPGQRALTIDRVSLELRSGELIALVGENGSGKTTLAKIAAGLYAPQAGRILWNGDDLRALDLENLRSQVSVSFQDFERYLFTIEENIGIGRVDRDWEEEAIRSAARQSGVDTFVQNLPNRYSTQLGNEWHSGTDLSLGQWQRIAISRSIFRDASLIVLDEPTASLDAPTEHAVLTNLRRSLAGRGALLISHRLSTVRWADRIYFLERGRVTEVGDHHELMRLDRRYSELFRLQASQYTNDYASSSQ